MERLQKALSRVAANGSRQEEQFGNVVEPVDSSLRAMAMTATGFTVAFVVDIFVAEQSLLLKLAKILA